MKYLKIEDVISWAVGNQLSMVSLEKLRKQKPIFDITTNYIIVSRHNLMRFITFR